MTKKFRNITLSICITILAILLGFFGATFVNASAEETTVPTEDNYNFSGYTEYNRGWFNVSLLDTWVKIYSDSGTKIRFGADYAVTFYEGEKNVAGVTYYENNVVTSASWEFVRVDAVDLSYYWVYFDEALFSKYNIWSRLGSLEKDGKAADVYDFSFKSKIVYEEVTSDKFNGYVDGVLSEGVDLDDTWVLVPKRFNNSIDIRLKFEKFTLDYYGTANYWEIYDSNDHYKFYYETEVVNGDNCTWAYICLEDIKESMTIHGDELPEGATLVLVGEHVGEYKYNPDNVAEEPGDNLTGTGGSSINNNKTNKAESSLEWYEKVVLIALSVLELVALCVGVIKAPGIKGKVIAVVVWVVLSAIIDIPFVLYVLG